MSAHASPAETPTVDSLERIELGQDQLTEEEMIAHLERDQLVAETNRPLPRARLSRATLAGLWALRVFVVLVSAMVIYTFVAAIH